MFTHSEPFLNEAFLVLMSYVVAVFGFFPIFFHGLLHLFVHKQDAYQIRHRHQYDRNKCYVPHDGGICQRRIEEAQYVYHAIRQYRFRAEQVSHGPVSVVRPSDCCRKGKQHQAYGNNIFTEIPKQAFRVGHRR